MTNEKLDLIGRKTLLRRLQKRREDFASAWKTPDAMPANAKIQYHENLACAIIVEDFPTVDAVEVVHGRWIDTDYKPDIYCKCSVCGRRVYAYDDGYNYCPNCGAKMDGGNEDG